MKLETLSANKLNAEIEKRRKRDSEFLSKLIAAGYGDYTGNRLDSMVADGTAETLVTEARKASQAYHAAIDELDARKRYHGSEKPIKRKSIY